MAGDWIPMRLDLAEDPAVITIAEATGLDEFAVIGRLHRLWSWANSQLRDGHAPSVTEKWLDRYVSAPGFGSAMVKAGWLDVTDTGVSFPKFDDWNSQGAKRRILAARRQRKSRHADVTPPAQQKRDQRREEKRRVKTPPLPPNGFDEFWSAYPRKAAKPRAVKAWAKLKPDATTRSRILADVGRQSASAKWQENGGEFIPHPATYLNQRRWEDEPVANVNGRDDELARRYAGAPGDDDL